MNMIDRVKTFFIRNPNWKIEKDLDKMCEEILKDGIFLPFKPLEDDEELEFGIGYTIDKKGFIDIKHVVVIK